MMNRQEIYSVAHILSLCTMCNMNQLTINNKIVGVYISI